MPIDAILFGGRRASVMPLVIEARSWQHGTFLGSIMASEKTAAAAGKVGELRRDPMAMLPFCGYHMGDYFQHWIEMGRRGGTKMPRIFHVNWFRKSATGEFLWPGFGENSRVLKWIFERCDGAHQVRETVLGNLPNERDLDLGGLALKDGALEALLTVDEEGLKTELPSIRTHLAKFGSKLPSALTQELEALEKHFS